MARRLRRLPVAAARGIAWVIVAACALAASIYVHQRLPLAKRVAAAQLQELATAEITGALAIGGIDSWGADGITFTHVVLFDPQGHRVVLARRLTLVPEIDPWGWLEGDIRFTRATLRGGVADLIDSGDGLPTLVKSFDSPVPDDPDAPEDDDPLHVRVENIRIERLRLRGDLLGLSGLVARRVNASGTLDIHDEVRVTIEQARGRVVRPFGFEGIVDSLTGTISTEPTEGVDLFAATRRGEQHADAHVLYRASTPGAPDVLDLRVEGDNLSPDTLRGVGFDWLPPLRLPVAGWARLQGPVEDLTVEAEVRTEAGDARVRGRLAETEGFDVTVETDGMELAELLDDAPDVHARGSVQVAAAPDEETPRVHAEIEPMAFGTVAVPRLVVDGTIGPDGIRVEKVKTEQRGGVITGRGRLDEDGALHFDLRADMADIARDPNLRKLLPGARGKLSADIRVSTPDLERGRMRFRGRVVLRDVRYGMMSADRLVLEGTAHGDPERPALNLKIAGSGVRFGEYPLGTAALTLTGGPKKYTASGAFESGGKRTFNVDATILAERGGFLIDADPVEVVVGDGAWRGAIEGLRVIGHSVIELARLRLADRTQRLEASGILRFDGEDRIEASLQSFELAAVRAILGDAFPLSEGSADATVLLTGDVERPVLNIEGLLRDGRVMHVDEVHAVYMVSYADGKLVVDGEADLGERGVVRLSGEGDVDPTIRDPAEALRGADYDLELESEDLTLDLFPALTADGTRGRISGGLGLRGTLTQPRLSGKLQPSPLEVPGWGEFVVLSEVQYDNGKLELHPSIGDAGGPLGSGSLEVALDLPAVLEDPGVAREALHQGPWKLTFNSLDRRLDRMPPPIAMRAPYPATVQTDIDLEKRDGVSSGTVTFDLAMSETVPGTVCADQVEISANGTLVLDGGATRLHAAISMADAEVAEVQGMAETPFDSWLAGAPIAEPAMFRASARLDVPQMQRMPFLCEYGRGKLRGELELDGGLSSEPLLIADLQADFRPRVLRPSGTRKRVQGETCSADPMQLRLQLNAGRDDVRVDSELSGCGGGASTLIGTLPVEWGSLHVLPLPSPERELKLRARFDNAQLKPLMDRIPGVINSTGIANGHVDLSGRVNAVRTAGEVELRSAEMYLIATGQRLTGIDASLEFMGNWARLKRLTASAGEGSLSATGGIAFDGFWPERLQLGLSLDEFPLQQEGVDLAWLDGHAAVDAEITPDRTRAAIKLHAMEVQLPDSSDRTLQPLEPHPDVIVVTRQEPERPEPYPIELVIDGRRPFRVRRNDFDMTITAELALAYLDPDLNIGGQIGFEKGEFEILGKRFDIESGSLRFDGTSDINPEVLLVARHQPLTVGAAPIGVSVIGTLRDPEVTFSSEECPGDESAATYLISGRCDVDDPLAAAEAEDAENAFAAGLAGSVGGALTPFIRGQMGGLGPRLAIESTGEDARLKAGIVTERLVPKFMRPLVQRVYVQGAVSTDLRDDSLGTADSASENDFTTDLLIELYFPHNLVGSGKVAPGNWGLDIIWEP